MTMTYSEISPLELAQAKSSGLRKKAGANGKCGQTGKTKKACLVEGSMPRWMNPKRPIFVENGSPAGSMFGLYDIKKGGSLLCKTNDCCLI
jgi:hypothetical protein